MIVYFQVKDDQETISSYAKCEERYLEIAVNLSQDGSRLYGFITFVSCGVLEYLELIGRNC